MTRPRLDILGAGKVGKTLARLWHEHLVFEIDTVNNQSARSSLKAISFIGAGSEGPPRSRADVLMISAADYAIEDCATEMAKAGIVGPDTVAFHCSGSLPSYVLEPLKKQGAHIGSVHPVKSFAEADVAVESFAGTFCAVEGDEKAVELLKNALTAIGGKPFEIDPAVKAIYHAGSVFASNYLIGVAFAGVSCLEAAGVDKTLALDVLKPIIAGTVDNLFRVGPIMALTGPIARGEVAVTERQLEALKAWNPDFAFAYASMGVLTADVSKQQGRASKESLERILSFLAKFRDAGCESV